MPNNVTLSTISGNALGAAQDAADPQHHFSLGQVLATVLLGASDALEAYTDRRNLAPAISNFVNGFLHIWIWGPAVVAETAPVAGGAAQTPPSGGA